MNPVELLEALEDRLKDGINELSDYIGSDTCPDFAAYKFQCGKVAAWRAVIADIAEIKQRYIDED
jgi:hypothetical protein